MVSFGGFGQPGAIDRTSVSAQLMVVIVGRKVVGSLPGPSLLLLLGHSLSSYLDDGAFPVLQDTNGSTFSTTCCRGWSNVYASIVLPHYAVCRKLLEERAKAKRKSALSFRFNYICEISRKHEICFRCFKPPENGVSFVPVAKCQ